MKLSFTFFSKCNARLYMTPLWLTPLLLAAAACDSSSVRDDSSTDCGSLGQTGNLGSCESEVCSVVNDAICAGNAVPLDCRALDSRDAVEVCGVPIAAPPLNNLDGSSTDLKRSNNVKDNGGKGAPALDCFREGSFPAPPGTPQNVTIQGIAKIFKNGCQSAGLEISVWTVQRDGSDQDGAPLKQVGATFTTPDTCDSSNAVEEDIDDCTDNRWECKFAIKDVPTETELLIKTESPGATKWRPLYEYNVYLANSEVVDGVVEKDVRALATEDYPVIARAALGKTVTPGNGAVAGEVHDCKDVRLIHAVVNINRPAFALTYFGNNEDDPLPDLKARSTGVTALYSALDVKTGPVAVASAGLLDGKLLGIGFFRAQVFPDAISVVTFRGLQPFQLPTAPK